MKNHHLLDEKSVYRNPKAMLSKCSKGRKVPVESDKYRTEYQRDVHRILYCQAFRRLKHKTQVFFLPDNDHICTRMEHVLLVASASRTIAQHLGFNEDLVEAISLAHDFGHAPFGHHGEEVLKEIARDKKIDVNFQHEIHGLRVVDKLAQLDREPSAGLNLTYEVRDGIISHCGEDFKDNAIKPEKSNKILENIRDKKDAGMPVTFEGCIVRMVDKIAYAGRDVEDALMAGLINEQDIPTDAKILGNNNGEIVGNLVEDLIAFSKENSGCIGLSKEKHAALNTLIRFDYEKIYKHPEIETYKKQASLGIKELFERLVKDLEITRKLTASLDKLPKAKVYDVLKGFILEIKYDSDTPNELIILDFISGMTDNYVIRCLDEIFVPKNIT